MGVLDLTFAGDEGSHEYGEEDRHGGQREEEGSGRTGAPPEGAWDVQQQHHRYEEEEGTTMGELGEVEVEEAANTVQRAWRLHRRGRSGLQDESEDLGLQQQESVEEVRSGPSRSATPESWVEEDYVVEEVRSSLSVDISDGRCAWSTHGLWLGDQVMH